MSQRPPRSRSLGLSLAPRLTIVPALALVLVFNSGSDARAAGGVASPDAAERIYVTAEDGGEVAVVDPASASVVARVAVGKRPRGVRISPDGRTLYVALSGSPKGGPGVDESKLPPADRAADGIGVIDLAGDLPLKLARVYPSGQDPESFDLSPDGRRIFISNEETAEMSVLDLSTGQVVKRIPVGREPEGVTVRPDGKVVYVTSEEESVVVAIDTASLVPLARIGVGPRPRNLIITADGKTAFVPNEMQPSVTVVDLRANRSTGQVTVVAKAKTVLGPRPMGGVLSRDGRTLFVSTGRGESVAVIDVRARKQTAIIDGVGARPWGIGLSGDGRFLYTANGPSNDLAVIELASKQVVKRIAIGGMPWGLAVAHHPPQRPRDAAGR
jgi:YVTN family beta-propeller protein